MKNLGTNEWTILNNIIYKIYTTEHFDEMRLALMEELRMLIDFDSADFYVAAEHDENWIWNVILRVSMNNWI